MKLKLELVFKDRVGIVSDVSSLLAGEGYSIVCMEVERRHDRSHVHIEADGAGEGAFAALRQRFESMRGLLECREVQTLPAEERENRIKVVLDTIGDGVMSIDGGGRITSINKVAREAYGCAGEDVTERSLTSLRLPDHGLLDCLHGRELHDARRELATPLGRLQFFVTRTPIRDGVGRIIGAVEIARDMREIRKLARTLVDADHVGFDDIVGHHPAIEAAIAFARRVAATDAVIAIRGESGTGKELFARAMHAESGRKGPFVPINCAALPEQLLESELFGYERGAFTGGRREGKPGLFESARGGTVFLDEIGDMPLASQAKILRVMQEQRVRRIGGEAEVPVDARIITATNRPLERMVEDGRFRQDLYYRINVLPMHIPPLRERRGDIPLLANHFLQQLASRIGGAAPAFTDGALARLRSHEWPGNVRELKNVVERAAILAGGAVVDDQFILFSHELGKGVFNAARTASAAGQGDTLKEQVTNFEKKIVEDVVRRAPSIRKAAKILGISHTALLDKMRRHGVILEE
ncbi:sigma 54-interacting transcriptional regulator [Nitratidesulfovibrio vulgaris]|uniref:sigma 54-interacting transcriptional regulator n=1 Tax=Nitratidesulfovibrio vulgaris TaxID=881 RepID=UPI002301BA34|nr:sigma 54-interacting transcriptional regulator [Nitratidesulfovibrio vulgaris]WCB46264.1 sigma 54-interacting transcriptional regulator [Nitratidesulfovibrio vulgaris]